MESVHGKRQRKYVQGKRPMKSVSGERHSYEVCSGERPIKSV